MADGEKDGHNDLATLIRDLYRNRIYDNFTFDSSLPDHVDLPRLRKGLVGVGFLHLLWQQLLLMRAGHILERLCRMPQIE